MTAPRALLIAFVALAASALAAAPFARREMRVPRTLTIAAPRGDTAWTGDTLTLIAAAFDTQGRRVPAAAITWAISDTASARLVRRPTLPQSVTVLGRVESDALTLTATWLDSRGRLMASTARAVVIACARRGLARELEAHGDVTHIYGIGAAVDHYAPIAGVPLERLELRVGDARQLLRFCLPAQSKVAYHFPDRVITDTASHGPPAVQLGARVGRDRTRDRAL